MALRLGQFGQRCDKPQKLLFLLGRAAWCQVTIRELLSHTAGFTDYPKDFDFRKDYSEADLLKIVEGADNVKSNVVCDALLLDDKSRSDTYPTIECDAKNVTMGHEASVTRIGQDQLFYAQSRGMSEDEANAMIVNGFIEPLVKELPMEYALELNRLIQIQPEGKELALAIRDQGVGIAAENLPRLFDRFFRVQDQQTRHSDGTGLGLYVSKSIVEQHGGRITVDSAPDVGSTFTVHLPIV